MDPTSLSGMVIRKEVVRTYMNRVVSLIIPGVLVMLIACINIPGEGPRISKDELKTKLGSPALVLLDVRARNDWEGSDEKITGAVRMDPQAVDSWAGTLPKDKEIVLYCA